MTEPDGRQWVTGREFPEANAFVRWKGTDVCMDFTCECGEDGHFDGFFAYVVECKKCGTLWEMPLTVFPRKSQRDPEHGGVVQLDDDSEEMFPRMTDWNHERQRLGDTFPCGHPRAKENARFFALDGPSYHCRTCNNRRAADGMARLRALRDLEKMQRAFS